MLYLHQYEYRTQEEYRMQLETELSYLHQAGQIAERINKSSVNLHAHVDINTCGVLIVFGDDYEKRVSVALGAFDITDDVKFKERLDECQYVINTGKRTMKVMRAI